MTFSTALSGLNAASAELAVTGNNIANANTTGFKGSRAEFSDVFPLSTAGVSSTAIGTGVRLAAVTQQFNQGNVDFTGNSLDLAVNGTGFFVLNDGGTQVYSRAGAFQIDADGYVVNANGHKLQAYPPANSLGTSFSTGVVNDLQLDTSEAPPNATTQVGVVANLSSTAADLSAITFDPANPDTYNYSTSLTNYDSLGQSHTTTMYFRNVGSLSWEVSAYMDGNAVGTPQAITFGADGTVTAPIAPVNFGTWDPGNGALALDVDFDFTDMTQYGSGNSVTALSQDGYTTGRLSSIDIDPEGIVLARFTNGQSRALGQLALASFANPQGLQQLGNNAWAESYRAGQVVLGAAGSGSFGAIQSGSLEGSNVDLAEELVTLITAQRNFQANAQVISTADAITQTIINIR